MAYGRSKRWVSIQVALTIGTGAWLFAGCSLVTGFDVHADAGGKGRDIEEHDAAASTPDDDDDDDGTNDEAPVEQDASVVVDAAQPDAEMNPGVDAGGEIAVDAGAAADDAGAPGLDPGAAQTPDGGAPAVVPDAGPLRPSVGDLIDAVAGERKDRSDRICGCPGAGQECVRAGFGKSSCLERAIMLLSGTSQDSVRALLECMLPAEKAYTKCVEQRLRCVSVEASTSSCDLEYELATTRCNVGSLQGLSLQGLCSRSNGR